MDPDAPEGDAPPDLQQRTTAELLPLVYDELRRLAARRVRSEAHANSMQPTSLVHAVYLRLIGESAEQESAWNGRGHFFASAALAMRRILVERARQRGRHRHGGQLQRQGGADLDSLAQEPMDHDPLDMLALDDALRELESAHAELYRVVMLRYFGGVSIEETAELTGTSPNTVKRRWRVARLWLLDRVDRGCGPREDAT